VITNWLLDHPWANAVGFAVLVLVGPLAGAWLAGRRRAAWWVTGASLLPVAVLTLSPTGRTGVAGCTVQWALPDPGSVELVANVLLFAVPALLATVAVRRPVVVVLAGSALSVVVEGVQAVALDLGRACDTTDWLCNSLGALLGAGLGWAALRAAGCGRGRARRASAPAVPRRSGTAPSSPPAHRG